MGEGQPLLTLGVSPDSIWGDENETIVYAKVLGQGREIIFRFYLDPDNPPHSLSNRVVSCYHDLEVLNEAFTFQNRGAMRSAIWSAVAAVWPRCIAEPAVFEPGTVIDLNSGKAEDITWRAYREALFDQYFDLLRNIKPSDLIARDCYPRTIDISEVVMLEALGGRGCCKRVQVQTGSGELSTFVFKGIDFQTYLQLHDDDDESVHAMVETFRRSSKLVADMPPHPNIQPPPEILVSVRNSHGDSVLMGHLSKFFAGGDLKGVIATANSTGAQIPLQKKAKWCYQMSLAIAHTHRAMHTFHMDIKPGNFVVDDAENLLLIDWEQSGAPATTLAPEADGTWDVQEQDGKLAYTKYTGPVRRNMPEGGGQESFNIWNVFPEWQASCPRALELAEVFALGRTMWMLLSQTADEFDEVEHPDDVRVTWDNENTILPLRWIEMVEKCMERDPNGRPSLADLAEFWKTESSSLPDNAPHAAAITGLLQ
ncbi:kinase-like domain-containing protein [Biscogniauxia mediterranea]|nr:kinase-like domain-containing protein [Biscogniauxia mediterranea]